MKVTVIHKEGKSALVQFDQDGRPRRVYIPASKISPGGEVPDQILELSISYGVEWEKFLEIDAITPQILADALRLVGIWTVEDLHTKDRQLIRVATNLLGDVVVRAANASKEQVRR